MKKKINQSKIFQQSFEDKKFLIEVEVFGSSQEPQLQAARVTCPECSKHIIFAKTYDSRQGRQNYVWKLYNIARHLRIHSTDEEKRAYKAKSCERKNKKEQRAQEKNDRAVAKEIRVEKALMQKEKFEEKLKLEIDESDEDDEEDEEDDEYDEDDGYDDDDESSAAKNEESESDEEPQNKSQKSNKKNKTDQKNMTKAEQKAKKKIIDVSDSSEVENTGVGKGKKRKAPDFTRDTSLENASGMSSRSRSTNPRSRPVLQPQKNVLKKGDKKRS